MIAAVIWASLILIAVVALATWASSHSHLVRTPAQVKADVARHRADRHRATCEAIYALPTHQRKEES